MFKGDGCCACKFGYAVDMYYYFQLYHKKHNLLTNSKPVVFGKITKDILHDDKCYVLVFYLLKRYKEIMIINLNI